MSPAPPARAIDQYIGAIRRRAASYSSLLVVAPENHPFLAAQSGFARVSRETIATVEAGGLPAGQFDAAVLLSELEHSLNPITALERVHAALRPDAALLVVTPSLDSVAARDLRSHWEKLRPENRHYFDSQTIQSALLRAGFGDVEWSEDRVLASDMVVTAVRRDPLPRPRLSIIMPVYNERATFERTVEAVMAKELPGIDKEIVIVESGSTDGTRDIVRDVQGRPGIVIVFEDRPRGKGHAVRSGFGKATGSIILIQDADDEYDVEDYDALLEPIVTYKRAFVLGSRHMGSWKMRKFHDQPFLSAFFNGGHVIFRTLLNVMYRQNLDDPFTMYKVFRRDCLHNLAFECNRFDFDYELVIKLLRKGYVPLEVPVNYRSRSFSEGKKVSTLRDPWTWIRALVKYRFASIWVDEERRRS